MPSRKKAKGKARKAAKAAKEEESHRQWWSVNQRQEGSLEVMMQQLRSTQCLLKNANMD